MPARRQSPVQDLGCSPAFKSGDTPTSDTESMPAVSVLLPVHTLDPSLRVAASCILAQTQADFELIVIANGIGDEHRAALESIVPNDTRVRFEWLKRPHLAAALNHGVRVARSEFIARMDADDSCHEQRLRLQLDAIRSRPELDAIGCAFEVVDGSGRVLSIERPPTDPREARWRLCLANPFAHGSMLIRCDSLLAIGGYDECLERAQDFDLWRRMSGRIGAVADVLYRYAAHAGEGFSSSGTQAASAAAVLARSWDELPRGDASSWTESLAASLGTQHEAVLALSRIGERLTLEGPTCFGLMAWMQCQKAASQSRSDRASQSDLLAHAATKLRREGVREVFLWGAGAHTAYALPLLESMGVTIRGIVDDAARGEKRFNRMVNSPDSLSRGDHVLISSDAHESAIWESGATARARGVAMHRIYGDAR